MAHTAASLNNVAGGDVCPSKCSIVDQCLVQF